MQVPVMSSLGDNDDWEGALMLTVRFTDVDVRQSHL